MVGTLAQEVAKAKDHPVQLCTRERKVLEVANTGINLAVAAKQNTITMAQGTTATGSDAGKITIAGMTASGVVICTPAEALGTELVLSHVIAGSGIITVYAKDTSATGAATAISAKKINFLVVSL